MKATVFIFFPTVFFTAARSTPVLVYPVIFPVHIRISFGIVHSIIILLNDIKDHSTSRPREIGTGEQG